MTARVLVVDDDDAMCSYLVEELRARGFVADALGDAASAARRVADEDVDVVVTDINLGGLSGLELCARVSATRSDVPVVVMTAFGQLDTAVGAIRAGAFDFVTKPFAIEELALSVERAARHRALVGEVRRLRSVVAERAGFEEMIGESPVMRALTERLVLVADADATTLITGESGTGKELVARALHRHGRRSAGPFVVVNCAAIPEELFESELFGHVRGAFTDARSARRGLFLEADGGTLFLDEIGEVPLSVQAKLLRALEARVVRPVGGSVEAPFDVQLVTATNRDLELAVSEGRFREDLFYRVNVVRLELPPLRARANDVLLLAHRFLTRFAERGGRSVVGMSSAVAQRLLAYPWPGNVRELQNCIEQAVALARFEELSVDDLPARVRDHVPANVLVVSDDPSELVPLEVVERRYVLRVLEAAGGNKSVAARILGLDRKTLYRRLESYEAADASAARSRGSSS